MFFPRLYNEKRWKKGPVPLREEQNQLFFDGFIRPSIKKIGPHFTHHLPGSYNSIQAVSHIARESSGSAAVQGAAFEVLYSEENLPRLWSIMQEALDRAERDIAADGLRPGSRSVQEIEDTSRLWQFSNTIFLCSYKDTKLWHQSSGSSIAGVLGDFRARCGVVSLEQEPAASSYGHSRNPAYGDNRQTQLIDVASEFLPTRGGHTALARRCCQYNTLRFLYGQSGEALLGRTAPRVATQVEDEADSDWDDKAGSSQEDEDGGGEDDHNGDHGRALCGRGSREEQAVEEGWKPPRIPRAATTEYPVHILRDSISITSEPRRTSPIFRHSVLYIQSYTVEEGNFNIAAI